VWPHFLTDVSLMQFICGREGKRKEKSKGFGGIGHRRWARLSREEDAKRSRRVREAGRERSVKIEKSEEWRRVREDEEHHTSRTDQPQ